MAVWDRARFDTNEGGRPFSESMGWAEDAPIAADESAWVGIGVSDEESGGRDDSLPTLSLIADERITGDGATRPPPKRTMRLLAMDMSVSSINSYGAIAPCSLLTAKAAHRTSKNSA